MTKMEEISPESLQHILQLEYLALLRGNLKEIEQLSHKKFQVLEQISVLPAAELDNFASLRSDMLRNQELAKSAMLGMRKALTRVKEIMAVRSEMKTYDSSGQKSLFSMRSGRTLSKRS